MLNDILPPEEPRPYYGDGIFYEKAQYGNEWIINQYFLYKNSIALIGPQFRTLINPVNIREVQKACVRDLHKEWKPKITDPAALSDSHIASYVVLNICRIIYTIENASAVSKSEASAWAIKKYSVWKSLIEAADKWRYGTDMGRQEEIREFIEFALSKAQKHNFDQ